LGVTTTLHPLPGKASSLMAVVAVAVGTGMGCGGGLLLAVLALVTGRGR
jgi:hypothetical protein